MSNGINCISNEQTLQLFCPGLSECVHYHLQPDGQVLYSGQDPRPDQLGVDTGQ